MSRSSRCAEWDIAQQSSMNELRRKIMLVLFLLFSALIVLIVGVENYQNYESAKADMRESLTVIGQAANSIINLNEYGPYQSRNEQSDPDMDTLPLITSNPVSLVALDQDGIPLQIYSTDLDHLDIKQTVEEASGIAAHCKPGQMDVGDFFTSDISWYYTSVRCVVIVDIHKITMGLIKDFWISLFIGAVFEVVLYFVCRKVTMWMMRPVEEAFTKQKQFIADASHELKTPLAVIMANAEALEQDPGGPWLENIKEESGRMNGLITSLLDLTRSEQQKPVLEKVDLSMLLEKQCLIMEAAAFEKNRILEEKIAPDLYVMAEKSLLTQVIAILIDNALEHSDGQVIATLERKGKEVLLGISNSGKPIPPEQREKIFERFYRADTSRNRSTGRYGLGLAIAKSIVESLHGQIYVECKDGFTTFQVVLRAA